MRSWFRWLSCGILVAGLVGCAHYRKGKDAQYHADHFQTYHKMTTNLVPVGVQLIELCAPPRKSTIREEQKKYGPHANTSILVYMNDLASAAYEAKQDRYPPGAVVVKQKQIHGYHDPELKKWVQRAELGVGGMIKRQPGYDSKHGDWEYFYYEDDGKMETGRITTCIACHASARDRDYVFGDWDYLK